MKACLRCFGGFGLAVAAVSMSGVGVALAQNSGKAAGGATQSAEAALEEKV